MCLVPYPSIKFVSGLDYSAKVRRMSIQVIFSNQIMHTVPLLQIVQFIQTVYNVQFKKTI